MIRLPLQELSQTAFAAFGQVVEQPARAADASGPGWDWWGETLLLAADSRPYSIGYLNLRPADLRFDWAERHMRSAELLIPMGSDCLVYVGPPLTPHQPGRLPPLTRFQVFRVRHGQGVLLSPGVWHGTPLAIAEPLSVAVLLLQGTGAADTSVVRFEDSPVWIDTMTR
jgi:ureidoglycolate lyase